MGKGRNYNKFESKVNPKQITDEKQLPGKVIERFATNVLGEDIRITFSDGTFLILEIDYSSCYYESDRPDLAICKEYRD